MAEPTRVGARPFALPPDLIQSRTKGIMGVEDMSEEKKRKEKSKVNPTGKAIERSLVSLVPFAAIVLLGWDIIKLIRGSAQRDLAALKDLVSQYRRDGQVGEEERKKAIKILRKIIDKFSIDARGYEEFSLDLNPSLEVNENEFNDLIEPYDLFNSYADDKGFVNAEYVYYGDVEETYGKCFQPVKHLRLRYLRRTLDKDNHKELTFDIYHIEGETERIETKCEERKTNP